MNWKYIALAEILLPLIVLTVAAGGTFTALRLEESDAFCEACHTQPEQQYFQQEQAAQPTTLASFHAHASKQVTRLLAPRQSDRVSDQTRQDVRCIDCHSGAGAFGRVSGLSQGAHDLLAYLAGHYSAPAVTTNPLSDASCIKCHNDITPPQVVRRVESLKQHFHDFLPLWHQLDSHAARCADCHTAHIQGSAGDAFLDNGAAGAVCDACHRALSGEVE